MYKTDAFARIQCTLCGNKMVDELRPGQEFTSIKKCSCQEKPRVEEVPLEGMTIIGLKKKLQEMGLSYGSKDTKADLIAKIKGE